MVPWWLGTEEILEVGDSKIVRNGMCSDQSELALDRSAKVEPSWTRC